MKKVILTGATGFIGQWAISPLLERDYVVHAVSSKPIDSGKNEKIIWHQVNLLDSTQIRNLLETVRPTHLLHFAWYLEHGKAWNAPENLDWLSASLNLVKNFNESGGKRLVICGTLSEYSAAEGQPLIENISELAPDSLYGTAKKALYEVVKRYTEHTNLSFAWGRAFFQFGENEAPNRLVASVVADLLNDRKARTSHGNQVRDYMCSKETAAAFAALLDSEVKGAVNIGSGEIRTIREIVLEIAEMLKKSEDSIEFGAIPVSANEPKYIIADVTRLRHEVKWTPSKNFSRNLEETVNWWKTKLKP